MYMMTFRVGVDIVSINRFEEDVLLSQSFLDRCFTSTEQRYCFSQSRPSQHFAVRVAGKEAVLKALSGFNLRLDFNRIEITNEMSGRPKVTYLTNDPAFKTLITDISLSHSQISAIAFALIYIVDADVFI